LVSPAQSLIAFLLKGENGDEPKEDGDGDGDKELNDRDDGDKKDDEAKVNDLLSVDLDKESERKLIEKNGEKKVEDKVKPKGPVKAAAKDEDSVQIDDEVSSEDDAKKINDKNE